MEWIIIPLILAGGVLAARSKASTGTPGSRSGPGSGSKISRVFVVPKDQGVRKGQDVIGILKEGETVGLSRVPTDRPLITVTGTASPTRVLLRLPSGKVFAVDPTKGPGFFAKAEKAIPAVAGAAVGFAVAGPAGAATGWKTGQAVAKKIYV